MNQTGRNKDKGRMRTVPNWKDSTWGRKRQLAHEMKLRLAEVIFGRDSLEYKSMSGEDYTIPEGERLDDNNWEYPTKQ
jgi:hypothetical protein